MLMTRRNRWIAGAIAATALFAAASLVGRNTGSAAAAADLARIERVIPKVRDLPEPDRAVVARAALACGLSDLRDPSDEATIECLRRGAEQENTSEAMTRVSGPLADLQPHRAQVRPRSY